ncbi:putative disease resistance protein RGA1 [Chenopodium quinoa]|uniref:putative disease resistance protein RGA1 n=1 Tax=Chenopodium quinoa TaxID=63459 RepID=UPI000B76C50F|nr:putative disease resistance protein RGA1 [Chenopodium quinoa]
MGQLRDLMPLINLRNRLEIELKRGYAYDLNNSEEGSYLLNKEHIKVLLIEQENIWVRPHRINHLYQQDDPVVLKERLLERLEPHHDLREIRITGYEGVTLPRWAAKLAMSLPRLVTISLVYFRDLQHLPAMSQLQHLKYLTLIEMPNVEFVEDDSGGAAVVPSFPSLESLFLWNCQSLKCFPDCPHVKKFTLCGLDEALTFCRHRDDATATSAGSSLSSSNNNNSDVFDLWELKTDNLGILKSLFRDSIQSIHHLTLLNMEVQSLSSSVQENNQKYAFSIHSLKFLSCQNLKSLSGEGIECLTNLKTLSIWECHNLKLEEEEGFPWKALHVLSDLSFNELPQLIHLPKGLQYLTTLQSLEIEFCDKLEALPEWLDCLKSLRSLDIRYCLRLKSLPEAIFPSLTTLHIHFCDGLKEKYSEPNGTDFPKICFIPDLYLYF